MYSKITFSRSKCWFKETNLWTGISLAVNSIANMLWRCTIYIYEFTLESHRKELIKKKLYIIVVEDRYNGDIRYLTGGKINEINFFIISKDNKAKEMKESEKTKKKWQ